MEKPVILIRADGNSQIGLGHVIRTLALAEMLQPDFTCLFAIREPSPAISAEISKAGCEIVPLPASMELESEPDYLHEKFKNNLQVVILDGYQFSENYQQLLHSWVKIVCLDDIHSQHFVAEAIINPAGGVTENDYSKEPYTKLYCGPEYALLRQPFLIAAAEKRIFNNIHRFFLNMGGADPENYTCRILKQLLSYPFIDQIEVVTGSAYQFSEDLNSLANKNPTISLHKGLSAEDMCRLMQSCDAAVVPPSSVAYEWCSVGGPLFILKTAANQNNLEQFLIETQLAFSFTNLHQMLSDRNTFSVLMEDQIHNQQKYFDGKSPVRLRKIFYNLVYPDLLTLRRAQPEDLMLLFDWINEPEVRKHSLNQAPIPLAMHTSWFQHKLSVENCFIFIAEILNEPVGMIRFDIMNQEAVISYLIDRIYRGKGLGYYLLNHGIQKLKHSTTSFITLSGLVQEQNTASVRAFEKAGFIRTETGEGEQSSIIKFKLIP